MLSREDNEILCKTGPGTPMGELFRRFWMPALLSTDLPEPDCEPVRMKLLGEKLVAFRDSNGRVGVLERHCPHRLADMWFGRNENAGLACAYHGWKFDVDGNCVEMPTETAESNYKHKVKMVSYPTAEWGGVVWVYMGPRDRMPELPQFEWCRVPDSHRVVTCWVQDSNYMQANEGDLDSAHVSFNHRWFDVSKQPNNRGQLNRFSATGQVMTAVDGAPRLTVKETDYGFVYGSRRQVGPDQYYWRVTQFLLPFFSLIPGPQWPRAGHCWVPIDDEHHMAFQYNYNPEAPLTEEQVARARSAPVDLKWTHFELLDGTIIDCWRPSLNRKNDYEISRAMQKTVNFTGIRSGREQDMAMTDGMGRVVERWREHLGTTDVAIIAARKILLRMARQLQQGIEPVVPQLADAFHVRAIDVVSDEPDFIRLYQKYQDMAVAVV